MRTVNCNSDGTNRVHSIKSIGVDPNRTWPNSSVRMSAQAQQAEIIRKKVRNLEKGSNLSITVTNTDENDPKSFLLFDVCGIAVARGATPKADAITVVTTFAGGSSVQNTYSALKESIKGTHFGSLGTMFKFSDEALIDTSNITIWNGNMEDYNSKSLQNYLQLAEDTYANDPKIIVLSTELWMNNFLAIGGVLPAGESITILFNVVEFSNF